MTFLNLYKANLPLNSLVEPKQTSYLAHNTDVLDRAGLAEGAPCINLVYFLNILIHCRPSILGNIKIWILLGIQIN